MRLTPKTIALLLAASLLGAVNFVDSESTSKQSSTLPFLPPMTNEDTTRIEVSSAIEKVVLERGEEASSWSLTAPVKQAADRSHVHALLRSFRNEVRMDIQVDTGNLKEYGLDASQGLVVEIWTDQEEPRISLTIGNPAPGGANFVRISGDDKVYRARIGGRARFELSASDWRNRSLIDYPEADLQGVSVKPLSGAMMHLVRDNSVTVDEQGAPVPGPWRIDGGPQASPADLARLVAAIGRLRANEILADDVDAGFSPPAMEITVLDYEGTETTLAIGTNSTQDGAFVRVGDRPEVFRVKSRALDVLMSLVRDNSGPSKVIFQVSPADIAALLYYQGRTQVELAPNDTGVWTVRRPEGLTIDVKDIMWAVKTLSRPTSAGIIENQGLDTTGLKRPRMVFEILRQDGTHEALYVGRHFRSKEGDVRFYVKRQAGEVIHEMDETTLSRLRKAFGQG